MTSRSETNVGKFVADARLVTVHKEVKLGDARGLSVRATVSVARRMVLVRRDVARGYGPREKHFAHLRTESVYAKRLAAQPLARSGERNGRAAETPEWPRDRKRFLTD